MPPALQADSLPSEPTGKLCMCVCLRGRGAGWLTILQDILLYRTPNLSKLLDQGNARPYLRSCSCLASLVAILLVDNEG